MADEIADGTVGSISSAAGGKKATSYY